MIAIRPLAAILLLAGAACLAPPACASLLLSPDGSTVADSQGVTWLADGNLAASNGFGVQSCSTSVTSDCINASGTMDYTAAQQWVANMNSADYLGHNNWQLPTTGVLDAGCTAKGAQHESFAYGCSGSALGSVYYTGLSFPAPSSVTPPALGKIGAFTNLQPNLYWSDTADGSAGYHTFSFATGWRGSNQGVNSSDPSHGVTANFFYVLPMIQGQLRADTGGQTVYDPASQVTWLTDGNLAAKNTFGLPICSGIGTTGVPGTPPCVNANGTMTRDSAQAFVDAMNAAAYLGQIHWVLPPSTDFSGCDYACAAHPIKEPMASLYYNLLGLPAGSTVAGPFTLTVGPFKDLQPYLYWSCPAGSSAVATILSPCSPDPQCSPTTLPGPCPNNMEWSFNFGDGFQGTDEEVNDLFVTAYYVPEPSALLLLGAGLAGLGAIRRRARMTQGGAARLKTVVCRPIS